MALATRCLPAKTVAHTARLCPQASIFEHPVTQNGSLTVIKLRQPPWTATLPSRILKACGILARQRCEQDRPTSIVSARVVQCDPCSYVAGHETIGSVTTSRPKSDWPRHATTAKNPPTFLKVSGHIATCLCQQALCDDDLGVLAPTDLDADEPEPDNHQAPDLRFRDRAERDWGRIGGEAAVGESPE